MRWENWKPKTIRAYRFTDETLEQIEKLAERLQVSRTAVIERAVEELLLRTPAT